jgi:hypothetical protein
MPSKFTPLVIHDQETVGQAKSNASQEREPRHLEEQKVTMAAFTKHMREMKKKKKNKAR